MIFKPKDNLTSEEVEGHLHLVIKDAVSTQAMLSLTSGIFLVALAIQLGASNTTIGLLSAIPFLVQLIQLPAIYLVEKLRNRKMITAFFCFVARFFWLGIASIPFFFSGESAVFFLVFFFAMRAGLTAVANCSWNSWMRDFIPQDKLGSHYSRQMMYATAASIPLSLLAGTFIDKWKIWYPEQQLQGYSILFVLGFLVGMIGVYIMTRIPEPKMATPETHLGFVEKLKKPFFDQNYRQLIVFLGTWNFAVNLAAPFFTVYMLKRLDLGMSFIIGLTILSQITNVLFLKIWGKFTDRFSNKSVLLVSGPLFMFCILAWTFTTLPEKHAFTIPLLVLIHIFTGISTAGIALGTGNIALKLAPKGDATSYLSVNSLISSLCAGIAPILGGRLVDSFAGFELGLILNWKTPGKDILVQTLNFQRWDFFFFFAFLIGLYSIHRLTSIREEGEVEESVVIQEFFMEIRRELGITSTVGGLRGIVFYPLHVFKKISSKRFSVFDDTPEP